MRNWVAPGCYNYDRKAARRREQVERGALKKENRGVVWLMTGECALLGGVMVKMPLLPRISVQWRSVTMVLTHIFLVIL